MTTYADTAARQYAENEHLTTRSLRGSIREAANDVISQWNWFPEMDTYLIRLAVDCDAANIREWADEIRSEPDETAGWPQDFCDAVAESMDALADAINEAKSCTHETTWSADDDIATYTACCYGTQGDEPGEVRISLELHECETGTDWYRWVERDDSGQSNAGTPTMDRDEAIRQGREYAEECDEEPDLDELVEQIEGTGYFADPDIIRPVIHAATEHSQGYLLLTPDISQPIGRMWTTNGYLECEHIQLPATYDRESYAADALLRAIEQHQAGDDDE